MPRFLGDAFRVKQKGHGSALGMSWLDEPWILGGFELSELSAVYD